MLHEVDVPESGAIVARCPVCGVMVPFAYARVKVSGRWRKRYTVVVDGDGTDFVAHLWSHRGPQYQHL